MSGFGLSFDDGFFNDAPPPPRFLDVHSIVMAGERPARTQFCIARERQQAEAALSIPDAGCRLECISGRLGFSSIAVIDAVARAEPIDELCVATFNVSRKRMRHLESLHRGGS